MSFDGESHTSERRVNRDMENFHTFCQGHCLIEFYSSASVPRSDSPEIVPRFFEAGTGYSDSVAQFLGQILSSATLMSKKSALCVELTTRRANAASETTKSYNFQRNSL